MIPCQAYDWYVSRTDPFPNLIVGEEAVMAAALEKDLVTEDEWNGEDRFSYQYDSNIVLLEAERQAELAALEELRKDPVHHAENELFTVDVVKVVARWNSYEITYIATNVSDSTLYIKGQDERWEDSGWTPSGAYGPGESWFDTASFYAPNAFEDGVADS